VPDFSGVSVRHSLLQFKTLLPQSAALPIPSHYSRLEQFFNLRSQEKISCVTQLFFASASHIVRCQQWGETSAKNFRLQWIKLGTAKKEISFLFYFLFVFKRRPHAQKSLTAKMFLPKNF
jgi:hypothetical protein